MIRRPLPFLALALLVLASACIPGSVGNGEYRNTAHHIKLGAVDDLYRFLTYTENRYPLVSAHRGGPTTGFPENAIETFENNYRYQPLIIECDIRMTRDSVLVLLHDETLGRTTTGSGKVADWNFPDLKELYLKDPDGETTGYRIPTLDEALRWGVGKVIFTLDVKRGVPYGMVIDAIQRNQAQAYSVIITYNAGQAAAVHQLAPDLMISASIHSREDLLRLNDRSIPDNRLVAFVGTTPVDASVYNLLHDHGILCILGTIGNIDRQAATRGDTVYRRLVESGADILATDRPREAGNALHTYRNVHQLTSNFIQ
ncbi:glycerophosphodiester phosphodiesterase family protein [Parapedobacter sp.]